VAINDPRAGDVNVAGTFDVSRFANQSGELVAIGTFTDTVTGAAGVVTSGTQQVALSGLNITAQSGPGNVLLGNLLCAVATCWTDRPA